MPTYHATPHCAFLLLEEDGQFTPVLYGRNEPIWHLSNRSPRHAFQHAMKWLDREDQIARRELALRGWAPMPLPPSPNLDSYSRIPEELFEDYTGEYLWQTTRSNRPSRK